MEDNAIIELYFARDPMALLETQEKYGPYCKSISMGILQSPEDAQECVNDTLLRAWDSIPPTRPKVFSAFLGRITRNLSIQRWRNLHAQKRGGGETAIALEELGECVSGGSDPAKSVEEHVLREAIGQFLSSLKKQDREIFLARYWYFASVREIAQKFGYSEPKVKTSLHRTRNKLRVFLEQEDFL